MMPTTLELQRSAHGEVTLWLDRPDRHNALDSTMIAELIDVFGRLQDDPHVRLLVLRGRGKHFCAGADLAWMQASAGLDAAANLQDARQLGEVMSRLQGLPFATLVVVQGAAFGGALGLVCCCDMAMASEQAQFCLSEVRIGLVPAVISPYVVQAIGARATRHYALSAARFDGRTAQTLGLVDAVHPGETLEAAVEERIAQLRLNGPQAMRATKALLAEVGHGAPSADLHRRTEAVIAQVRASPEGQEGLQAFLQKRRPSWQEVAS